METENYQKILTEFENKASLKQAIYRSTAEVFALLKKQLATIAIKLQHAFHTTRHNDIVLAQGYALGGQHNGLGTRCTYFIDCC